MKRTTLAAAIAAIALAGCASHDYRELHYTPADLDGYEWTHTLTRPPLDRVVLVTRVDNDEYYRRCPTDAAASTACAERRSDHNTCYILTRLDALTPAVVEHERKHCAGYDHIRPFAPPPVRVPGSVF